ncbi:MAG: hypothetical protein JWM06_1418 [Actinomycetia bacterium]|nr:hypothetical protein [Actinomycetes bacterium]
MRETRTINARPTFRRLTLILLGLSVAALIAAGIAPADDGHGKGHWRDHTRLAPVLPAAGSLDNVTTGSLDKINERAGELQHAPGNLEQLKTRKRPRRHLSVAAAVPPAPTITAGPANPTMSTSAAFTFSDADPTATFQCSRDTASYANCTSPRSYSGLGFGAHTFRVLARNASGASVAATYSWTINPPPIPPVPTITSQPANPTTATSASFTFTEADPAATLQCSLDGASYATCTSPRAYAGPLSAVNHTFRVRARNAGGASSAASYSWRILPPPPGAPAITSAPTDPATARSATFAFSSPGAARFQCSLDTAGYSACTSPTSYAGPLSLTRHTFNVRAVNAGGTGPSTSYSWTINLPPPPPAPTITAQPASQTTDANASFTFSDADPVATFQCSLDGGAYAACTSPKSYPGLASTSHTFAVQAVGAGGTSPATTAAWSITAQSLKMRLLVISADGKETDFPAIKSYLDQLGVPYTSLIATTTPLTAAMLSSGLTGNYQGVILATGNLTYSPDGGATWASAFTADEWTTLWNYEAQFHVRQVTSFTFPYGLPDDYGLNLATYQDTLQTPLQATLTDAGKTVFPFLNPSTPITFKGAWVYLATKRDASVTPLVQTSDGYVIASTNTYPDGRENLAVTAANNPFLLHSELLAYGLVNWVTRGVFLGERHVSMNLQIDDLLIDSNMWDPVLHTDHDADPQNGTQYRLDGTDWQNIINWQSQVRARSPLLAGFTMEWAFNGEGAFGDPPTCEPIYPNDTLTPAVKASTGSFNFLSHTFDHQNVDLTTYASSVQQIQWNLQAAGATGLGGTCPAGLNLGPTFDPTGFVQPDISGLTNTNFLQAAYDNGIRYLITDTSQAVWNNPSPNAGFNVGPGGSILAIPRHPTNLFYSLRTPTEWIDEYNWFYWKGSASTSQWKFWDTPQTYAQIVDHESDSLLSYLVRWDIDPLMFHQANLGRYDASNFLLADVLNATFDKYLAAYNLPVVNLSERGVGLRMAQRMAYNASGVDGTLIPCQSMTLNVTQSAAIPVTGASAGTTETYGGQPISTVQVTQGSPTTIPVTC